MAHSGNAHQLGGQRFGRLVVIGWTGQHNNHRERLWECLCDCGATKVTSASTLIGGKCKSCGCLQREAASRTAGVRLSHGHAVGALSPTYRSWRTAKIRCYNVNANNYHRYGGRGITMCDRWRNSFEAFLCDMGERPPGTSIDRINNDGNYEPSNCRWATASEQAINRNTPARASAELVAITPTPTNARFAANNLLGVGRKVRRRGCVYYDTARGKWYARYTVDRKAVHVGHFDTKEHAEAALYLATIERVSRAI